MSYRINLLHGLPAGRSWVELDLGLEAPAFQRHHVRSLQRGLVEYLDLEPRSIRTLAVTRWDPSVVFELPAQSARHLVARFKKADPALFASLAWIPVDAISQASARPRARASRALPAAAPRVELGRLLWRIVRGTAFVLGSLLLGALAVLLGLLSSWAARTFAKAAAFPMIIIALFIAQAGGGNSRIALVFIALCAVAIYFNLSALYHLERSRIYSKSQVLFQTVAICMLPFLGAVTVLHTLGEASSGPALRRAKPGSAWRRIFLSPRAVRSWF